MKHLNYEFTCDDCGRELSTGFTLLQEKGLTVRVVPCKVCLKQGVREAVSCAATEVAEVLSKKHKKEG